MSDLIKWLREQADLYDQQGLQADFEFGCKLTEAADRIEELEGALDKLARLGNEPHYGNSTGNRIAQAALKDKGEGDGR